MQFDPGSKRGLGRRRDRILITWAHETFVHEASSRMSIRKKRILIGLVALYLCSYVMLSRYGESLANRINLDGFWYVPCDFVTMAESEGLQHLNALLSVVYFPLWLVDYTLFGFPHWAWPHNSYRGDSPLPSEDVSPQTQPGTR
jgi:hypothetical protein